MSKYAALDAQIIKAIEGNHSRASHIETCCSKEIEPIALAEFVESFRILDRRLQALRKSKKIEYISGRGWRLSRS